MEMQESQEYVVDDVVPGSFEARMQERRKQREQRTTEVFDVPGFEDLFKVEMKVLGYKRLAGIAEPHTRVRDDSMRALYIAADQILASTVAFHRIMEDGSLQEAEGATWFDMAHAFDPTIDGTVKPRAALIRLLDGQGVLELSNDWYTWNGRGNAQVDKDLGADFQVTR
jgi:hypothetical protein